MNNNIHNLVNSAILFDMDGTIVDSQSTVAYHFVNALNEVKQDHIVSVDELKPLLEISFEDLLDHFGVEMSEENFRVFLDIYRTNYRNDPLRETKVFKDVPRVLTDLRSMGFSLLLATGKCSENAQLIMEELDLVKYFDHIQGWEEGLKPKPHADILQKALEHSGKKGAFMVGDTYVDIKAGKSLQMKTVACSYGFGRRSSLIEHEPDFIIDNINELLNCLE